MDERHSGRGAAPVPRDERRGADGAASPPTPADLARVLEAIRIRRPLVHASMNTVAQAFVANVVTALGTDVSMTSAADGIAEMVTRADVLLVNLGTLDPGRREGIEAAVAAAGAAGVPFVLDPVKVDRAPGRRAFAERLIALGPAVVKANAAEAVALADALDGLAASGGAVAETGAVDRIVAGGRRVALANGTPLLSKVIATGCASGAVVAAAFAVEPDALVAATAGLAILSVAAEIAAEVAPGPGSFAVRLLDALDALSPDDLERKVKLSHG